MDIHFKAETETTEVNIHRYDVDYLPDVLESFFSFLKASGYTYVDKVTVIYDDGREVSTF